MQRERSGSATPKVLIYLISGTYVAEKQEWQLSAWLLPMYYVNGKATGYHPAMSRENSVSIKSHWNRQHQRNLTIRFSGFTYSEPAYMSYECKMEGMDERLAVVGWYNPN